MGYCMQLERSHFKIKRKNFEACLKAIKDMDTNKGGGSGGFSWVNDVTEAKTLAEALSEWRWDVEEDKSGVTEISFSGEKSGDDDQLFTTIAPYVESGCYIEMRGEDGAMWRWLFTNGKFSEISASIDWECSGEIVDALLKEKAILPTLIGIHPMLDKKIELKLKK